ncbi:hypothetical protein EON66_08465 [archaeon]|nr:MAG: hypothetical protein EON66_08465 [archaeon]
MFTQPTATPLSPIAQLLVLQDVVFPNQACNVFWSLPYDPLLVDEKLVVSAIGRGVRRPVDGAKVSAIALKTPTGHASITAPAVLGDFLLATFRRMGTDSTLSSSHVRQNVSLQAFLSVVACVPVQQHVQEVAAFIPRAHLRLQDSTTVATRRGYAIRVAPFIQALRILPNGNVPAVFHVTLYEHAAPAAASSRSGASALVAPDEVAQRASIPVSPADYMVFMPQQVRVLRKDKGVTGANIIHASSMQVDELPDLGGRRPAFLSSSWLDFQHFFNKAGEIMQLSISCVNEKKLGQDYLVLPLRDLRAAPDARASDTTVRPVAEALVLVGDTHTTTGMYSACYFLERVESGRVSGARPRLAHPAHVYTSVLHVHAHAPRSTASLSAAGTFRVCVFVNGVRVTRARDILP